MIGMYWSAFAAVMLYTGSITMNFRPLLLAFLLPLNLPYYIPLLPSITSDCCRLDDYVSLHYLLKHMAHLVQAAVWTAGLDDRLTDSGLISFQLCKAYAPPVGVKGQISTVCLYTAGGNLASKDNFILFYLGRFDGGTVFRCIMISLERYSWGA